MTIVCDVAGPIFDHSTVAFATPGGGSACKTSHFEIGRVRPSFSRTYVSPRFIAARVARLATGCAGSLGQAGLSPAGRLFRVSVLDLFLLSDLHVLVTPRRGLNADHPQRLTMLFDIRIAETKTRHPSPI